MKIGILKTGHPPDDLRETYGDYGDMFGKLLADQGLDFVGYNVVDMAFPASVQDCDGWLLTGSKHGAYEDLPFIAPLETFIREAYAADVPLVGICFGHQIVAQALGGKVEKFREGWAVGRQVYDWDGEQVALNAWHQDQVTAIPESATICASNDFCEYAALVYGQKVFTVQGHPEYNTGFINGLARLRGPGVVPDAQLAALASDPERPLDDARLARQITKFFKERVIA